MCVLTVVRNEDIVPNRDSWPSSVTYYTKRSPVGYETSSSPRILDYGVNIGFRVCVRDSCCTMIFVQTFPVGVSVSWVRGPCPFLFLPPCCLFLVGPRSSASTFPFFLSTLIK